MIKRTISIAVVVVLLTTWGVLFAIQRDSLNRIRQENAAMSRQAEELDGQVREAVPPAVPDGIPPEELKSELLLLRERAARLRDEISALKSDRAQTPPASSGPRKSFGFTDEELRSDLPKNLWIDSGYATPRDALLSTLRAQCSGDLSALSNSFTADAQTALLGKWMEEQPANEIAAELVALMQHVAGFRLLEKPASTADRLRTDIFVEFLWNNGVRSQHVVVMERDSDLENWKVANAGTLFGAPRR